MRRLATLTAILGSLVWGLTSTPLQAQQADDKEAVAERGKLTGTWRATEGVWAGTKLTKEQASGCALTIPKVPEMWLGGRAPVRLTLPDKLVGYKINVKDDIETRYITSWEGDSLGV